MFNFMKKPIELPRSGAFFVVIAIIATISLVSNLAKGSRYFGYYLLGFSILITITGIGMAFSKKERERTRAKVTAELPDRAALINAPMPTKLHSTAVITCWQQGFHYFLSGAGSLDFQPLLWECKNYERQNKHRRFFSSRK